MASNTWSFTGSILKCKATRGNLKGGTTPAPWGKAWMRLSLDPITRSDGTILDNNVVFLQISLDYDPNSKNSRHTKTLVDTMREGAFVAVHDAKIDKIKRSRKNDDGAWEDYFEVGIRARPNQIRVSSTRLPSFNEGLVAGTVSKQKGSTAIVEEPYMIPGKKVEWKKREIPLVLPQGEGDNLQGRYVVATAQLSGIGPSGNYAICGYVKELMPF